MLNLNEVSTKNLVDELLKRDGVEYKIAKPYEDESISVNGPAILIKVID